MSVTYDDVARTLPQSIVDTITASMPCPASANHQHLWQEERVEFDAFGRIAAVRVDAYWWCTYCRVSTATRPVPPVGRPWAIITADEFLRETS